MNKAASILNPRADSPFVSLVIPVYNESESVDAFIQVIKKVFRSRDFPYELVFVNDGSSDSTLAVLIEESRSNPNLRIVNLSRNFRKEAALTAGLDYAKGNVIIPIDVDLQDPPEIILSFIDCWKQGYDVVCGVRSCRKSDGFLKRNSATLFYKFFNLISPDSVPENVGDFRLMDRRVVEALKLFPERNRFMKGIFALAGFSTKEIPYERPERTTGKTKWNYWKLWNFALDGVIGFSTLPLRIWLYLGAIISLSSFAYASIIFVRVMVLGIEVPGYASLMTVILFLGGIQVLSFGVMGEYLARLFIEVKRRPIYIVQGVYEAGSFKPGTPVARDQEGHVLE
jgi:glycosyltransferase involved in cell wall biosynthesis